MTKTLPTTLLATFATVACAVSLGVAGAAVSADQAQGATATAAGCGVSVTAKARSVRRGGKVLLQGEACGAKSSSSSSSSSPSPVRVKIQKNKRWATVAKVETDSDGQFEACARVSVPKSAKLARIKVTTAAGSSTTTVRVSKKGTSGCAGQSGGAYQPPPPDTQNPDCPLSQPGSKIGLNISSSCSTVWSDTASNPDPTSLWGATDCQNSSRHQVIGSGGDSRSVATGSSQGNSSFRRLTVNDGDYVYGERCELGFNNWSGPTAFYHEGQRRATFISLRMGNGINVNDSDWRTVMQMKQAQGYRNPNQSPILELQVHDGRWWMGNSWNGVWSAPAQGSTWTRFAFDITYSQDPSIGSIKVYVDLNGDGDASDANEESPQIHTATLRAETAGTGYSDYEVGESIPDHLRAGIYQNPNYACPSGCSVDVDNVQVVKP